VSPLVAAPAVAGFAIAAVAYRIGKGHERVRDRAAGDHEYRKAVRGMDNCVQVIFWAIVLGGGLSLALVGIS
jgi:hypothetical protein